LREEAAKRERLAEDLKKEFEKKHKKALGKQVHHIKYKKMKYIRI
jgi:hypothetical protein